MILGHNYGMNSSADKDDWLFLPVLVASPSYRQQVNSTLVQRKAEKISLKVDEAALFCSEAGLQGLQIVLELRVRVRVTESKENGSVITVRHGELETQDETLILNLSLH